MILTYEDTQKISAFFENYEDIVAYADGSSLKNPGRVSKSHSILLCRVVVELLS